MWQRRRWIWLAAFVVSAVALWLGLRALRSGSSIADSIGPPLDRPELILQTGHPLSVVALAFSPDGRHLASAGGEDAIKIWNVAEGREVRSLVGHSGDVRAVAFNPDGTLLASAAAGVARSAELKLWEVSTGEVVYADSQMTLSMAGLRSVSFDPGGRALFLSGLGGTLLELPDGKPVELVGAGLDAVAISANWEWTAKAHRAPSRLEIVNALSGEHQFVDETDRVHFLAFSSDSQWIVTAGFGPRVIVREVASGRQKLAVQVNGLVQATAISPDGRWLAVGTHDDLRLWELASGRPAPTTGGNVESLAFSPDGRTLAAGLLGGAILLWDLDNSRERGRLEGFVAPVDLIALSGDGRWLATAGMFGIDVWSLEAGGHARTLSPPVRVETLAFSADGSWIAIGGDLGEFLIAEPIVGTRWERLGRLKDRVAKVLFSRDGSQLVSASEKGEVEVWSVTEKRRLATLSGLTSEPKAIGFSPANRSLMAATWNDVVVWDLESGAAVPMRRQYDTVGAVAFSADWRRMAWTTLLGPGPVGQLVFNDFGTGQSRTVEFSGDLPNKLAFSPDGSFVVGVLPLNRQIKVWDATTGIELKTLEGHDLWIRDLSFSPDGFSLVTADWDGTTRFWSAVSLQLLGSLVSIRSERPIESGTGIASPRDWAVVTPDGYFDGTSGALRQIFWRFRDDLVSVAPVESFFNEFYAPELLADLVRLRKLEPPPRDLRQVDRRQPRLKLSAKDPGIRASGRLGTRTVELEIHATEAPPDHERPQGSGLRDLRVFRNGSLVHVARGELVLRNRGAATVTATVAIVAGENRITAYAFNRDNVKSADAMLVLTADATVARPAVTYLIAIGIDQYENPDYHLKYAVADATAVASELEAARHKLDPGGRVEVVRLLDREATRENILRALGRLAGTVSGPTAPGEPAAFAHLARSEPEDTIIIYYAGHGTAAGARFYLIPHDLGYTGRRDRLDRSALETILSRSISDEDLERAIEPVDAARIVLVIDACNSGQALDAKEKRRGPMNSRGLAQLAYEKGMFILTAAQSYQAALEAAQLGHGYLTYALVEEGLKAANADRQPQDDQIALREWFDYAAMRVPAMQRSRLLQARLLKHDVVFVEGDEPETDPAKRSVQQPRAFYRRERERPPYIVASRRK